MEVIFAGRMIWFITWDPDRFTQFGEKPVNLFKSIAGDG
jgi:hypothetical protein